MRIVVMGVAGCGKTTIGSALAARLGATFIDADALHPEVNVQKMAAGEPLTDDDRWPWLARVRRELRAEASIVIACSALKQRYRDMLRHADGVHFVFLDLPQSAAVERAGQRIGHFMSAGMVASQFEALERPARAEVDVVTVDAAASVPDVVAQAVAGLATITSGFSAHPLLADGATDRDITDAELVAHVDVIVREQLAGAQRVLLVPPDHTRLHSRAGTITSLMVAQLEARGCEVGVLPALGTHVPMSDADAAALFGDGLPASRLLVHDWRHGLRTLGEISADEVAVLTDGRFAEPIPVALDQQVFADWDAVVSIGQVVPHEVIGMANFTKNIVIGLGGAPTIHRSHFIGAVAGMEGIMGRAQSAVRDVVDAAFDRYVSPAVRVLWVLTVVEDTGDAMALRGLFVGEGSTGDSGGAAFRAAAELARSTNIDIVETPLDRVVCWLDPLEFHSTWLGNKALYRTRMALADNGELIVLAPGVRRFGEDDTIDALIRRHGYRGTPATLAAVQSDPELAANLSAAAHLIHGSSEGRFRVIWCTDPASGGLTREEVEGVGDSWRSLPEVLAELDVDATTHTGERADVAGVPFVYIANPAMGLWSTAEGLSR